MANVTNAYTRIMDAYARVIETLIVVLMYCLMAAVTLQIMGRYVHFVPRYLWAEEVARMALVWMIFFGSMIGLRDRRHFYVDFLPRNLPSRVEQGLNLLYYVLLLFVSYVFVRYGFRYVYMGTIQTSELTGINLAWLHAAVPVAGFTWALFLIEQLVALVKTGQTVEAHEPEDLELIKDLEEKE
ncbi:MAG: TRAP transporter small permease [Spirochaetaceae bacterium]